MSPRPAIRLLLIMYLALTGTAAAQSPSADTDSTLTWRTSIKVSSLLSRAPDAPLLFPDRNGLDTLWRIRTEPAVTIGPRATVTVAYDQRLRWGSGGAGLTTAAILPGSARTPFRTTPLHWSIAQSADYVWEHEIDRLNVRAHVGRADITLGRQAIGWGRGVMFGAVDLFAPFSPLEADREWRRGVDAARVDVALTDRSSIEVIAAGSRYPDNAALAARVRGYAGSVDVEVMGGRRGRDLFTGTATSAAIGDAAVHGEVAFFRAPSTDAGADRTVWKAVAGGSYRFPIGSGVLTYAEYHYSGFGAPRPGQILPLLSADAFRNRYLRGDMQILSRHALAVIASYEQSPNVSWSGEWVFNPADGSAVLAPGFTFTLRDHVSVDANGYVPYGPGPAGVELRSEYGAAPLAAFLQLRLYY